MKFEIFKQTWKAFNDDKAPRLAAAIAYSTIFSIAPLFVISIAVAGNVLDVYGHHGGRTAAEDALLAQIRHGAGNDAAVAVDGLIRASFGKARQGLIAQILGWSAFFLAASGLFGSLQDALDTIWHTDHVAGGWKRAVRDRIASFVMILIVGLLLLVTLVANALIAFVGADVLGRIPFAGDSFLVSLAGQAVNFVLAGATFAFIFKVLPNAAIAWRDVAVGAALTAVLFIVGEALIGLYLARAGIASAYGAAGSVLVALLWIYYSALILLLGAEFTKVYANDY